jgi:uncharacterized protein (DUF1800 family)
MALPDRKIQATIAVNRFGLGAKGAELASAESDPRGWLEQQLGVAPLLTGLPAGPVLYTEYARRAAEMAAMKGQAAAMQSNMPGAGQYARDAYAAEVTARSQAAATTDAPLAERLVWFWSNHFTVSSLSVPALVPLAGAFEREAIRPYVLGSFANMLAASTRHPAMLTYLDNGRSVGPNSPAGQKTGRGLNENLGREVLELHTLGVTGGYTQQDVTTFAKALTGWTVDRSRDGSPGGGAFKFEPQTHEPGDKTILGKSYADDGEGQAAAVLRDIAVHPATARHVATKLARHFIADTPPGEAVDRLAIFLI